MRECEETFRFEVARDEGRQEARFDGNLNNGNPIVARTRIAIAMRPIARVQSSRATSYAARAMHTGKLNLQFFTAQRFYHGKRNTNRNGVNAIDCDVVLSIFAES